MSIREYSRMLIERVGCLERPLRQGGEVEAEGKIEVRSPFGLPINETVLRPSGIWSIILQGA